MSPQPKSETLTAEGLHQHSCTVCQQRKVKCDRLDPTCSNCIRAEKECVYRIPAPPKRQKRKASGSNLQSRLKKCEELLQRHGISLDDVQDSREGMGPESGRHYYPAASVASSSPGTVHSPNNADTQPPYGSVKRQKKYTANNTLWNDLHQLQETSATDDSREEDEVSVSDQPYAPEPQNLGEQGEWVWSTPQAFELAYPYPPMHVMQTLWRIFQENVDPITKVLHVPTATEIVQKASRAPQEISRYERPLVFATFAAAINSMSDQDCITNLGENRSILLQRYRAGARLAFANAKFIGTRNLKVLQALVIFLSSLRADYDPPTLWGLIGIANRIAQRIGLDNPARNPDVTPFESELRSRTWYQLAVLDAQVGELTGAPLHWDLLFGKMQFPLNIEDEDLKPDMTEMPSEKEGPTRMMFTLLRLEFGSRAREIGVMFHSEIQQGNPEDVIPIKDRAIDEIENDLSQKFLRYCDPLIPHHFLVIVMARCVICKARFEARHPRHYADRGASLSDEERERLFTLSLKTLEYECLAQATGNLRGFRWHIQNQVQFTALIYLLGELRKRTSGAEVDKAWGQVEEIYRNHPEMAKEKQTRFFTAIRSLLLAAWERREADYHRMHQIYLPVPPFISQLRADRSRSLASRTSSSHGTPSLNVVPTTIFPETSTNKPPFGTTHSWSSRGPMSYGVTGNVLEEMGMGFDPMGYSQLDWSAWDDLLREHENQPGPFGSMPAGK